MSSYQSLIKRVENTGITHRLLILKVRIVRSYTLPSFGFPDQIRSYEIVCHDRVGDRINGTITLFDYNRLKLKFGEGDAIGIQYAVVQNNNMKFKTTSNEFMFTTCKKTRIVLLTEEEEQDFPRYPYDFRSIPEISNAANIKTDVLLGKLHKCIYYFLSTIFIQVDGFTVI